jgi:hypothetical protein
MKSLAPSIYGNDHVKMALALSLFGGQGKVCAILDWSARWRCAVTCIGAFVRSVCRTLPASIVFAVISTCC